VPFVDRRRELRLLAETLERATESGRGHLVTLVGEPGIGKSRLAEEFVAGLPEATRVLQGRSSAFGEDVTFAPLGQMLLQEMGVRSEASAEELRERLDEMVGECCPVDEAKQVAAKLGVVLGLGEGSRADRRYRVAEIRSGLLRLLEGISRRGPVVLVFEDMHLADTPLLDLVEQVIREAKGIPLLVLVVARFDLLDDRPEWGGGLGDSVNLYLEPMSLDDAVMLAREAGDGLDEDTAERIARHAGGNPFFIVETTSMLLHRQAEMPHDAAPLPELLLPPTVQAVIASRIDHLPTDARDLIRKASVFARSTFDVSELALICEPQEMVLKLLEEEELLARDEERPDVWRFRHGVVRDVAYDSLPKRERLRLHNAVADGLEADPDTARRYPRAIAYHRERAARESLDLDARDRTLADRAVAALVRAGFVALNDNSEPRPAADLYERALALWGPERAWGVDQARVLAHLGEARYWLGEYDAAVAPLRKALELGGEDPAVRSDASRLLGDIELSVRGNIDKASEYFESALAAARQQGNARTLARSLLQAAWAPYWRDDLATARAIVEEALDIARSAPGSDPWAEARALITLAGFVEPVGDQEDVLALGSQALAVAEPSGDRFSEATAREVVGNALRRMMRLDEALPHLDAAVIAHRDLGARWELASALTSRGNLHRLAGRTDEALRDLREAFRLFRDLKDRSMISWTASSLARVLAATGETAAARQVIEEAAGVAMGEGDLQSDLLLAESVVLLAERDREGALQRSTSALAIERERGLGRAVAALEWWVGRLFGADVIGGQEHLDEVRGTLAEGHQEQALREPDLVGI
jgi:tetratricopeptide (TPR) repeat protein